MNKLLSNQNGSTILIALGIAAALLLLLTIVLTTGVEDFRASNQVLATSKAHYLAKAAVSRALAKIESDPAVRGSFDEETQLPYSSLSYRVSPWGCYLRVDAEGSVGTATEELAVLVGRDPDCRFHDAVTVLDVSYPLVLAGSAAIYGPVNLGPQKLTSGEIRGRPFRGSLPNPELVHLRGYSFPQIECEVVREFLDSVAPWRENCPNLTDLSIVGNSDQLAANNCVRTYGTSDLNIEADTTAITGAKLYSDLKVTIRGSSIVRESLIQSNTEVVIAGSAQLVNCVVLAPAIKISQRSSFSGQAIATNSLDVTDLAKVGSKTTLYLMHEHLERENLGNLEISTMVPCSATVVYDVDDPLSQGDAEMAAKAGVVKINANATLIGRIVSDGYAWVEGAVLGGCTSRLFYYYEQPTTYLNWIVDGRIYYASNLASYAVPFIISDSSSISIHKARIR